jgi:cardiolipin synthase
LIAALGCAQHRVVVVTPYFLPDDALSEALNVAALRGVQVDIILPQANNLALVKWASTAILFQVLERGCRVWLSAPPFDHTKLMLVDEVWTLLGSANWDPRSLRLNFEFTVECYDRELSSRLTKLVEQRLQGAKQITLAELDNRFILLKIRDGVARLLSPYL